ncbi:MAG: hypothetical protein U0793_20700 [Gemmataceae bacterium]
MTDLTKPRPLTLPLDYFRGRTPVQKWKGRLALAALGLTVVGVALAWAFSREVSLGAAPAPVASPHQAWDATCSACHEPFQAISAHAWAPPGMSHASGEKCQACHAGPAHHKNETPSLNCAACHREHRGPGHSLVRLADADCTQCHRDLAAHSTTKSDYADVTRFAAGSHPDFRSIKSDPGKLKFNHALHMTPGMAVRSKTGLGGVTFTLKNIPAEYRKRYLAAQPDKGDDAPVQLDCRACHQLDAADFPLTVAEKMEVSPATLPPRSAGAYFLPITYENQCRACHPLNVPEMKPDGSLAAVAVPHRKQPTELAAWLRDYYTAQAARGMAGFWDTKAKRPLPGKMSESILTPKLKELVEKNVADATKVLYEMPLKKNCALCHEVKQIGGTVTLLVWPGIDEEWTEWQITPPNVPQVWLKHARFDHMAHRAVDCRECHDRAYASLPDGALNEKASVVSSDVLVPAMDNCVKCHAPASGGPSGGVRFDCVLCHRYHDGDHPLAGRGATSRGAAHPRAIESFLRGQAK